MVNLLVLARSRACLYETEHLGDRLAQVSVLINPAAHLPEHEVGTDAAGRALNRMSGARQAYSQQKRFHSAAALRFLQDVGKLLDDKLTADESARVVLIASPR